ncbi:MAG: 50S rRNA methyltransferase [Treponema sp. GWB1_62_6]|nr:MAG: 50S rRNA methyltransferase [Treponema sp. GWA1_62_8]OHE64516.1 MAG: 50S rRNA methyltransferase [Treponema sp. GWC1_61_84]OHE64644.1 MAG: 50S rRNA methyltransferase [Treponema sp. GWB1_62_6]OHE71657.1 MAG: 50S rRNA methyltransferase [Treponema sp. RIFOXYC1_FULL_61_9]HCM25127.1 50S rRNA methyltransferase [Treponema sp.]
MNNQYEKMDHWSLKAQKEGYPARSVYKLKEMDEKFGLLRNVRGGRVLDIGAAPGSWSLYALRKMAGAGFLAAVDLSPLSRAFDRGLFEGDNFFFVQGDVYDASIREALVARGPYRLVMSDVAPSTTGNRSVDTLRSLALAEEVVNYAELCLEAGGNLVVKVFQGGDTQEILKRMRLLFTSARGFKPETCRPESFETYYLGIGKR